MWWWFTWMGGCGCGSSVVVCVLVWGCERDWSMDLAPRKQLTFPLIPGWSGKEPQAAARRKQAEKKEAAIEEERATFHDLSEQGERKRERVSEWELVNSHIFSQRVSCNWWARERMRNTWGCKLTQNFIWICDSPTLPYQPDWFQMSSHFLWPQPFYTNYSMFVLWLFSAADWLYV